VQALHFTCAFDVRVPAEKSKEVHSLLAMINENCGWVIFDLWTEEGLPLFRHALLLRGTSVLPSSRWKIWSISPSPRANVSIPPSSTWCGAAKSPQEAMASSILETVGEA